MKRITPIALLLITLFACDRIKSKGHNIVDKTKEKAIETRQQIIEKKNELIEKAFPTYDCYKADTENNKKRFKELLQTDITTDIKNLYTYGDFMGADYKVLIAFTCDRSTIARIIDSKKMKQAASAEDNGLQFLVEFDWWNKKKIEKLVPYKTGKENEYWKYLWYDPKTRQAFYEEFSL